MVPNVSLLGTQHQGWIEGTTLLHTSIMSRTPHITETKDGLLPCGPSWLLKATTGVGLFLYLTLSIKYERYPYFYLKKVLLPRIFLHKILHEVLSLFLDFSVASAVNSRRTDERILQKLISRPVLPMYESSENVVWGSETPVFLPLSQAGLTYGSMLKR